MAIIDYAKHLEDLRKLYVNATVSQRFNIARQRMENPGHDPNRIIAYVSAVEGVARSLVMHEIRSNTSEEIIALYKKYRNRKPVEMIVKYLQLRNLPDPNQYFGKEYWDKFLFAIEYRNLLAHECTYLAQDISPPLIDACTRILSRLAESKGLTFPVG